MLAIIRTNHLLLKASNDSFSQEVLDFITKNRAFLAPWEVDRSEEYYTFHHQKNMLAEESRKMEEGLLSKFWLFRNEKIIGSVALSNIVRGAFQSCHLGYRIDEEEQGKGFMTEAVQAVVEHAFKDLLLHRIEANIMPRNTASLRVVEKLGFVNEGLSKKYLKINGVWEDHIHMVLLNEEVE